MNVGLSKVVWNCWYEVLLVLQEKISPGTFSLGIVLIRGTQHSSEIKTVPHPHGRVP